MIVVSYTIGDKTHSLEIPNTAVAFKGALESIKAKGGKFKASTLASAY